MTLPKMKPCPHCGSSDMLDVYTYDHGARRVECSTSCGYMGPACTSVKSAIKYHNDEHQNRTQGYFKSYNNAFKKFETRVKRLEEALGPFAVMADAYDPFEDDDDEAAWDKRPTIGDLRRARTALEGQ